MFIGHLPAGFLVARALAKHQNENKPNRIWWIAALIGSVFPDFDMLYFYLIDGRQTLHHHYWTHMPFFWLCVALVGTWHSVSRVFLVGVMLHLWLDTIAGGILWLWPFSERSFVMVQVPAVYDWWVWNFVLHWTFGLEIIVLVTATIFWRRGLRDSRLSVPVVGGSGDIS